MKTDTQTLVGALQSVAIRFVSAPRPAEFLSELSPLLSESASRLQELDGENTQLKLRVDQLEKKVAKVGG